MRKALLIVVIFMGVFFITNQTLFAAGQEVGSADPFSALGGALSSSGTSFTAKVTCYAPGADPTIEGPYATSLPNAFGKNEPMTLDCVRLGQCKYVTLASNPKNLGNFFYIGTFKYRSPIDGNWYTLENLVGFAHDRGSAFDERQCAQYGTCGVMLRKMDVAVGDFRDPKWRGGVGSRFVDTQPQCRNVDAQWRQLTGAPNIQTTISGSQPGGPIQSLNNMTGGALGNSPLGRFLGLQPTQQAAQQQATNGVTGSGASTPSYVSTAPAGGTSAPGTAGSGALSLNTPSATNTTGSTPVSLPLTEAALAQAQGINTSTSDGGVNTTNPNAPIQTLKNTPPTLLCVPGVVEPDEQAMIFWSCNDESTNAEVTATTDEQCETLGKTSGVMCARPAQTTTYTLNCSAGTSAQCVIEVINPTIALISTPRSIIRGGTVDISWNTQGVEDCVLKSNALPSYVRRGVTGDVVSHTMLADTTFTLVCETRTGTIREKEIVVEVI